MQWERIEIHLPRAAAVDHIACLMVDGKYRNLPVGAKIDKKNRVLYWHVPNAYKGDFDLFFLQPGSIHVARPTVVQLHTVIDVHGNVKTIEFVKGDSRFRREALRAVKLWK